MESLVKGVPVEIKTNTDIEISEYRKTREKEYRKYTETLDPPKKNLKVSVVVPTFAELESDNFWRLIRSLMYQRGANQDEYEVICVINNSEEIATAPSSRSTGYHPFEGGSGRSRKERYLENQDHLKVIKIIKEAQKKASSGKTKEASDWIYKQIDLEDLDVSDYEIGLMQRFASTGISLQYIDASSPGRGFNLAGLDKSPIGLSRDIGSYFAFERFRNIKAEGMIDFLDGDCFMGPNYIKEMKELLKQRVELVIKPLHKVVAEIPRDIVEEKDLYTRIASTIRYLATVYSGFDYYHDNLQPLQGRSDPEISTSLGGPQLAIRSNHLPVVGGYPTNRYNSDWDFCKNALAKTKNYRVDTLRRSRVLMSDRGRDVSIDGKLRGALVTNRSHKLERDPEIIQRSRAKITEIRSADSRVIEHIYSVGTSGFDIRGGEKLAAEYESIKNDCYKKEVSRRILLIEKVGRWLEGLSLLDYKNKSAEVLLNEMSSTQGIKKSDLDLLEQNLPLVELGREIMALVDDGSASPEDKAILSMIWLETLLPEYFEVPPSKPPSIEDADITDNLANYIYIFEAIYLMESRLRDFVLKGK